MTNSSTLSGLIAAVGASPADTRRLEALVDQLRAHGCNGLEDKLAEYGDGGSRSGSLIAELRMALTLLSLTKMHLTLQRDAAADLRLGSPGSDWTVEVEHKSSVSTFAEVFCPLLDRALETLPVEIHPWLDAKLVEPCWDYKARSDREHECVKLANWLVDQLRSLPMYKPRQLVHALARFDVKPLPKPPGRMCGAGPLNAGSFHEYPIKGDTRVSLSSWLADAITRKARKAPGRQGAMHFVGLVVDEVYASTGDVLTNTFLAAR